MSGVMSARLHYRDDDVELWHGDAGDYLDLAMRTRLAQPALRWEEA